MTAAKTDGSIGAKMARIKSGNTRPEILVRQFLFSRGFRFRIHVAGLPGKPDIVLKKYKAIVLVNGCFWHAHDGCRYKKIPHSNPGFWENKINGNVARDLVNQQALKNLGWCVYIVWECGLHKSLMADTLNKLELDILAGC